MKVDVDPIDKIKGFEYVYKLISYFHQLPIGFTLEPHLSLYTCVNTSFEPKIN